MVEWVVVARKKKRDVRGFLRMGDMVISFVLDLATIPSKVGRRELNTVGLKCTCIDRREEIQSA